MSNDVKEVLERVDAAEKQERELPDSPFEELNPGQLCVMCEGFTYLGRIAIPSSAKRSSTSGRIIAASPDSKYKRNDRILFTQFAGTRFICNGIEGLRTITEAEVIGRLREKSKIEEASE
jgi:co-chaperonin GroES (HSP10)